MALPPVGVKLVAEDATSFDNALKTANTVLNGFGQTATAVTTSVNSAFSGMAASVGSALAPIGNIFDKIFNQVFRVLIRQAVREIEQFIGSIAQAAVAGSGLEDSINRLGVSLDAVAKSSFAPFVDQLGTLVDSAAPAFLGIVQAAESYLGGLGQSALAWGENFVNQFAQGMWDAVGSILSVLTDIANLITYWLSPGSPPRLLPDLDKWGTSAATEFFNGWAKGDFSAFSEISNTITNLIRSIPLPKGDQAGVIPSILGARQGIAAAVEELRTTGAITAQTMDAITQAVGSSDAAVRGYLESMVRLQAANDTVKAAQEELNKVTQVYQDLLKPVNDEIAGITEEQQQLADEQKKSLLQLVLKDPNATLAEKRQAQLEIERLDAEKRRRALLAEQKVAVEGAQDKLDAAKTAQQLAQDDFDARKALIAAQTEQNNLLKEQLRLLEALNKAGGAAGGPKPAGGGKPTIAPFDIKPFDIGDLVPPDVLGKLGEFVAAFQAMWAKVLEALAPAIEVWNSQVVPAWEHLVNAIVSSMPDIESAIAQMVAFVVLEMGTVLTGVFANVAISLDTLAHIWEEHHQTILAIVEFTFKLIFTTISTTLLLISGLVALTLNQLSGFLDAWSLIFQGKWQAAWNRVVLTFSDSWDIITDTLGTALEGILLIVGQNTDTLKANWQAVWDDMETIEFAVADIIRDDITSLTAAIGKTIRDDMAKIQVFWSGVLGDMARALDGPINAVNTFLGTLQDLWQWLQDHVFHINLPDLPSLETSSSSSLNSQVSGPASSSSGASTTYNNTTNRGGYTYAPTYVTTAPPPAQGMATMQALFG